MVCRPYLGAHERDQQGRHLHVHPDVRRHAARAADRRVRHTERQPLGRRAPGVEPRGRPAPSRRRHTRDGRRHRRSRRLCPREWPARRRPVHRSQRASARGGPGAHAAGEDASDARRHDHAAARVARVEPGVLWMDVTYPAGEHGLAPLAGSSPDVGVVGYVLGGGISWLGRKYGLAANSVVAIELVDADGDVIRASSVENSELFWALRGGGGNFGIVTAIEIELYPVKELYAGWLIFPMERADEVLNAWRDWVDTVPDEVTSVGRLLQVPPLPDIPAPLRGRRLVVVEAAMIMDEDAASKLLKPLRRLRPEMDTFATIPASGLQELHMDPPHPVPGIGDHMLLTDLTPMGIEKVVAAAGAESTSPLLSVEFRHLGGEIGRVQPGNGATASIDARFAMFEVGMTMDPVMSAAVAAYLPVVKQALARYDSGREYLNFAEHRTDVRRLWPADTYHRLRHVKAEHDPMDIF